MDLFSRHPRIYLLGAYGYGNIGDEACRVVTMEKLKEIHPNIKVDAHHGLKRPVGRSSGPLNINPKHYTACVLGGGGFLYDHVGETDNLAYYLGCVKAFLDAGRPVYVLGVGTQGMFSFRGKHLIRQVLNKCNLITVRSERTKSDLVQFGVEKEVHVAADLAFLLKSKTWAPPDNKLGVGISLDAKNDTIRPFHEGFNEKIRELIPRLRERHKLGFYCFDSRFDLAFTDDTNAVKEEDPRIFLSKIAACKTFTTTRYHGLVFTILAGVPCLPIFDHNDKKARLATRINYPWSCQYSDSVEMIEEKIEALRAFKGNYPNKTCLTVEAETSFILLKEELERIL